MARRKICIVTGTRAEYGLLYWLMLGVRDSAELQLQLVVTGMHLSPEFGLTSNAIEADGLAIDARVEMLLSSDTAVGVTKSLGLGTIGFADAFDRLRPDVVVVLGDRFEILAAATAAMIARIPIAHIHGGEITEGVIDESIRHALTKLAHLHFVAAHAYRRRVIQLGEQPERVHCVGGLGVDNILRLSLLDREQLQQSLNFRLGRRNLLVTFHPVTLASQDSALQQLQNVLTALGECENTHLIFTMPNADAEGRALFGLIEQYVKRHPDTACVFKSLGQLRYLSCIRHCDAVVGNSSSALIEAPALRRGSIDIGDRQKGRLKATSVIECEPTVAAIRGALHELYSETFQATLPATVNPYGGGGASERIVQLLRTVPLEGLVRKRFYDLPPAAEGDA